MSDGKKKTLTATAWARDQGYETAFLSLTRTERAEVRAALKRTKRAVRVREVAAKADIRLAQATAIFEKKAAFAGKQIAARTAVEAAEQTLERFRAELATRTHVLSAPVTTAAPTA